MALDRRVRLRPRAPGGSGSCCPAMSNGVVVVHYSLSRSRGNVRVGVPLHLPVHLFAPCLRSVYAAASRSSVRSSGGAALMNSNGPNHPRFRVEPASPEDQDAVDELWGTWSGRPEPISRRRGCLVARSDDAGKILGVAEYT